MLFEFRCIQFISAKLEHPPVAFKWRGITPDQRMLELDVNSTIIDGASVEDSTRQKIPRPLYVHPWPVGSTVGANEWVDPYAERRWPSYLSLSGRGTVEGAQCDEKSLVDLLHALFDIVQDFAIEQHPLKALIVQKSSVIAFKWVEFTSFIDFCGNPRPRGKGTYANFPVRTPIGPGWALLTSLPVERSERIPSGLLWSQSISAPKSTTKPTLEQIEARVEEIRRHWNSFHELKDANRHIEEPDLKAAIRSAASAVEAAIKFYAAEWGVPFPPKTKARIPFEEKIELFLQSALRPSFRAAMPHESSLMGDLYHARNSMHEGDNYFKNQKTGIKTQVTYKIASELVAAASTFCFWLDSQA